ncbi:unnamed protein product [Schistocephalus solidus]|uniref:Uncharacterized protein n=1 Tax=Schistocephalus solidus TaxID=70667 RepID=A0A183S850_SCHSO|nr:unnamed protein product [Schistocephalus solidus]
MTSFTAPNSTAGGINPDALSTTILDTTTVPTKKWRIDPDLSSLRSDIHITHRPDRPVRNQSHCDRRTTARSTNTCPSFAPSSTIHTAHAHSVITWTPSVACASMKSCGRASPVIPQHHISPHLHLHHT